MISKIAFLLGIIAVVSAVPSKHKAFKRPNHDNVDYYDCSGKPNGQYIHPFDCTRFIICSNGNASDMACADCDMNNHLCDGNPYTVYDHSAKRCEWPANTTCVTDPSEPETGPCPGIAAGDFCNKTECSHCGWCEGKMSYYFRCDRQFPDNPKDEYDGKWVHEACDADMWWNPDLKPANMPVGGACDKWENLSNEVKEGYRSDPNCVPAPDHCEWGQDAECSAEYWYIPNEGKEADKVHLKCNAGIWDPATETCRACENVAGCDGKCVK